MKKRAYKSTPTVKLGVSRQVVIPKAIHDELGLRPGDYLQVEVAQGRVMFTPKALVDKHIEQRIQEGLDDFTEGRTHGPFDTAEGAVEYLHAHTRPKRARARPPKSRRA